jgi:peptidyl-prolyl cis-trans isomerase C
MKQFILTASVSASLALAQGTAPAQPKSLPAPPSPQEVLQGRPAGAPAAPAVAPDKVVLTVGDQKVTAKEFESYIEGLPEQLRQQARGPLKRQMAEQIVRVKLLSNEAKKQGLAEEPAMKSRIAFQVENLLAGAAYNSMLAKAQVDDESAKKYYDEHKNEWEEVNARHILVKYKGSPVPVREGKPELTEEQALAKAQELRKKVVDGADFAAIAKAESDDTQSGSNGGDLGTFKRNSMVPEFEKTAFALPVGQVSEPIKTQFGYHIIKVEKHDTPELASVRAQIDERMKPEMARQAVENLAKGATVVMDDAYFGPAAAPTPVVGPGTPPPSPASGAATDGSIKPQEQPAPKPPASTKPASPKVKPAK